MPVTNPQTLATLRDLGYLVNDRIDTAGIAKRLAEQLEADHIAASLDQVQSVETTVGQLAAAIIGIEDPDFIDAIRPLLSSGATGKVQHALSNGYMLCASRATITVNMDGETRKVSVGTRFLSADHDVLERYVLEPRVQKAERLAESSVALRALAVERQPTMAPRLDSFMEKLNVSWQKAIEG